jgi:hypothetical protein
MLLYRYENGHATDVGTPTVQPGKDEGRPDMNGSQNGRQPG